jgi:hypothetical protein
VVLPVTWSWQVTYLTDGGAPTLVLDRRMPADAGDPLALRF